METHLVLHGAPFYADASRSTTHIPSPVVLRIVWYFSSLSRSALSIFLRSVISRNVTTAPVILSWITTAVLIHVIGKLAPSFFQKSSSATSLVIPCLSDT